MKGWLPNLGWVLLGLLIIAGVLISAGRDETTASPKASSYYPSGTAAFAELLRRNGFSVSIDRSETPRVGAGDLVVAFTRDGADNGLDALSHDAQEVKRVKENLDHSSSKGATVVWLPIETDFAAASLQASNPQTMNRRDDKERQLSASGYLLTPDEEEDDDVSILTSNNRTFVAARKSGSGYEIHYADGIGLTNRFIDKGDNAKAAMEIVKTFAGPSKHVVFAEGTFGDVEEPGLLEMIGSWAEAAWFQLLFLLAVVVFTLNRRFGLPEQLRARQRGGKELLDAITDTLTRARASQITLESSAALADSKLRNALKLPKDASAGERDRLLPESLRLALADVRAAATIEKMSPRKAFALIQKLEAELTAFLNERRSNVNPRTAKAMAKLRRAA